MSTTTDKITVYIPRDIAQKLCDDAGILIHEEGVMPGVPEGTFYDTNKDRWTWELDEAVTWAIEALGTEQ